MRLTPHFTEEEFLVSATYPEVAKKMKLKLEEKQKLYLLCLFALEHVRYNFGKTMITSGKRDARLNEKLGGVPSSQHVKAEACDFICPEVLDMKEVYEFLTLTLEWPGEVLYYQGRGHIHIGLPSLTVVSDHLIV